MSDTPLAFDTATNLVKKIKSKEISSRELTDLYIGRIKKHDPELNAVPVHNFDRARAAADTADAALAKGEDLGPLHGIPMTIKEAYNVEGLPTTWGLPPFADNIAQTDAQVVKRLKGAGAHFMGLSNVPANLADFQSYNDIYGTTHNPWDLTRTPGGSSGGSAAALAAGLTALESGSDIGGSIRNPAHYCGVYGHKPTWGIVPSQGHALPGMLAPPDIAVLGPLARSAEDLTLSMDVVAGADPMTSGGWTLTLPKATKTKLSDFRVAIMPSDDMAPVSKDMSDRVQEIGEVLSKHGATVSDTARPQINMEDAYRVYLYMLNAVTAAGFPQDEIDRRKKIVAEMDPNDQSISASMMRSTVQDHRDWLTFSNQREHLRLAWRAFFDEWDILICPQVATTAFPHDHTPFQDRMLTVDNTEQKYFQQLFWAGFITGSYLPSTVFPTGPAPDGLPIGLQAVSAEYNDYTTIEFARLITQEVGGFTPPPGY